MSLKNTDTDFIDNKYSFLLDTLIFIYVFLALELLDSGLQKLGQMMHSLKCRLFECKTGGGEMYCCLHSKKKHSSLQHAVKFTMKSPTQNNKIT